MRVIVLGAGAIGSFFGAKLSKLNDVTLIGRQQHADEINRHGLKIIGLENKTYKLNAATKIQEIYDNTLILLTTKVYDSKEAVSSIKNLLRKDSIILCMQNGLYSENIVKKIIGKRCTVLRAVTNFGAVFSKPGVVQYNWNSYTAIEKSSKSGDLAENFTKCGLNGYVSGNIKLDMWKKVVLNCIINPLTAILRVENRGVADERLNALKKSIVQECKKVAEKDGVILNVDFVKTLDEAVKGSRNISSMYQDITKGKCTEIDYLNGAVVELGRRYDIRCPVNEALVDLIKFMERSTYPSSIKQQRL